MNGDNAFWQHGCPALMNDDRIFRSYVSSSRLNQFIMRSNNIKNEHEYRRFLINNAEQLMQNERDALQQHIQCKFTPSQQVTLTETPVIISTPASEAPAVTDAATSVPVESASAPAVTTDVPVTNAPAATPVVESFSNRVRSHGCSARNRRWM